MDCRNCLHYSLKDLTETAEKLKKCTQYEGCRESGYVKEGVNTLEIMMVTQHEQGVKKNGITDESQVAIAIQNQDIKKQVRELHAKSN